MAETVMSNLRTRGTLAVVGLASFAAVVTFSGAITGTSATFTGNIVTDGTFSGATLVTATGVTIRDNDGGGCTRVQALNGTVSGKSVTCP